MNNTSGMKIIVATMMLALVAFLPITAKAQPTASKTLENLQTAYNGESNARAKYMAYAEKADQEGYAKVARLFRAAARAEEIHAGNHAEVIKSLGATPEAEIKLPEIKSTEMNLKDAIEGETYEQKEMYPEFLKQARLDQNHEAIQTFRYALDAEGQHARLYQTALDNLSEWKVADMQFTVCPTCGFTIEGMPTFAYCPVCATPKDNYLSIS